MENPPELQSSNDSVHIVPENQDRILIEDVELEEIEETHLGDTQVARNDGSVADITIGRTSLETVFTEIVYGKYKTKAACRIMMDFFIQSQTDFGVKWATLKCQLARQGPRVEANNASSESQLTFLRAIPRKLDDDKPTVVGVKATTSIQPEISAEGYFTIGGVGVTKEKEYTEEWGWHLHATITTQSVSRDCITWNFTANQMQKDSQYHKFSVEALIGHGVEPFQIDFVLQAGLSFGGRMRAIGRRKKIATRRLFSPYETPVVFSVTAPQT